MPIPFLIYVVLGCTGGINCIAFSPDQCFNQAIELMVQQSLPEPPPCQLKVVDGYGS